MDDEILQITIFFKYEFSPDIKLYTNNSTEIEYIKNAIDNTFNNILYGTHYMAHSGCNIVRYIVK